MKNYKTFYETKTASHLQEITQPSPNPPPSDKMLLRLWKKNLLWRYTEIYRIFTFKVLAVLGSHEMVFCKCFLWHRAETCLLENFYSQKGFWLYYESILFSMSSESRSVIWVMFFERNCIVRWAIFFPSFCWLWDFLLENLKWKRNSKDVRWYIWANTNNMRMPGIIFSKKEFQMWHFESFIFWSKFLFWSTSSIKKLPTALHVQNKHTVKNHLLQNNYRWLLQLIR